VIIVPCEEEDTWYMTCYRVGIVQVVSSCRYMCHMRRRIHASHGRDLLQSWLFHLAYTFIFVNHSIFCCRCYA